MKVLLAKKYNAEKHDIAGWLVSEKLDGMRAYWTGEELVTRGGKPIHAPSWFTEELPRGVELDGELFAGRGEFQKTVSICRKKTPVNSEWEEITYMIFDMPSLEGDFEERYEELEKRFPLTESATHWIQCVPHTEIESHLDLRKLLKEYEDMGAEGLMLRNPRSLYKRKRSKDLLKVKSFKDDDAEIIGIQKGEGKHEGRMGALICELDNGIEFKVGTGFSDKQRENPPKVGERIIFSYFELTNAGVPRFPAYVGVRID